MQKYWNFRNLFLYIAICCGLHGSAEEANTSGLVGRSELVIDAGKSAPNGYVFFTNNPRNYTGVVNYAVSSEGCIGIRGKEKDGNFGSWEVRPAVKLSPGGPYQASVSVKHSGFPAGNHIGIEIFSFDASGKPTLLAHILHRNQLIGKWHTITGDFTVPPDSVSLRIRLDLTCQGEVFFKDFRLENTTESKKAVSFARSPILSWAGGWIPRPDTIVSNLMPTIIRTIDGSHVRKSEPFFAKESENIITFTVNGEAGEVRAMSWEKTLECPRIMENMRYYTIRYRGKGILRVAPVEGVVQLKGTDTAGKTLKQNLLNTATVFDDGEFHTVTGLIPEGITVNGIQVNLKTNHSQAQLELAGIEFTPQLPLSECAVRAPQAGFHYISIDKQFNTSLNSLYQRGLEKYGFLQDALPNFSVSEICWAGIPFHVRTTGNNLIQPPFDDSANRKTFPFLGKTGTRKNIAPISRQDKIVLSVGKRAREAYLLLFGINNPAQNRFALPHRPLRLDDMENFHVELSYADGSRSTVFPYSVENKAFYISGRTAGAYAVALNPELELKDLILHFPSYEINFYLAALTLAENGRILDFIRNPAPAAELAPVLPREQKANISLSNGRLCIGKFSFDLRNGLETGKVPGADLHPASGLLFKLGNDYFTGRCFTMEKAVVDDEKADIRLRGNVNGIRELSVSLRLRPGKTGDLIWSGSIQNNGTKVVAVSGAIGAIQDLKIGSACDDRIFFPRSRAEISERNATYRAAYGLEFLHMFFDFYNPAEKKGFMILCDNRDHAKNEYRAAKRNEGMSGAVYLQEHFAELKPGQTRQLPEIRWQPHDGDWHSAMMIYRRFLDSFYQPVKSQNKDYFLNTFVNTCYHTTHTLAWSFFKVPPILSKDKSRYHIDEVLNFEKKHLGRKPDFVHLWWSFSDDKKRFQYGNWSSEPFYRQAGGLQKFREAIRHFQDETQIPVSLYTISDRCMNEDMPQGFSVKESALTYPNGSLMANDKETYTCLNYDAWVNYAVADLTRLMNDTGAKILYSDVISSFNGTRCYNYSHGHEVPSNSIKGDIKFISRLRAALPDDVALWTEYGLPDSASAYSDGFISYYFMELNEHFAPVYDIDDRKNKTEFEAPFAAIRYLLPYYKLFGLPTGLEAGNKPSQVDYIFFNGEVFHEVSWFMHESNVRERVNRALAIKDRYRDCFLTANPEPRVPTLTGNVYANRFSGAGRTVWTLFNAAPVARSGNILAVPHINGATYRDLWNNTPLTPEIRDGMAVLSLTLPPQGIGAVSQECKKQ